MEESQLIQKKADRFKRNNQAKALLLMLVEFLGNKTSWIMNI